MAFSSYFETTPPRKRESLDSDDAVLIFRPFGSAPKIFFKNVYVGDKVSKSLLLQNPQNETLEIELVKLPPAETGISFNCKRWQLTPQQETTLAIIWQPTKEGKSIHSVHLKTNTNARFYFNIVCVSVLKKPLKKKGNLTRITAKSNQRVVLKSSHIPKKDATIIKKTNVCREKLSLKPKLTCKVNVYSSREVKSAMSVSGGEVSKLAVSSQTCVKNEVKEEAIAQDDDLKNWSSETYDVASPGRNLSVDLSEGAKASSCTLTSTQVQCTRKEISMFADLVFSPIQTSRVFQPQQGTSRETFALSTPLSCISESSEISNFSCFKSRKKILPFTEMERISDDSLSPASPAVQRKIQNVTEDTLPFSMDPTISPIAHDNAPNFVEFNFSPEKQTAGINVSGISELDGGLPHSMNTFEITLPPFTPLQISKHGCLSANVEKPLKSTRNLENEFCIERNNVPEVGSNLISEHNLQITPLIKESHIHYDTVGVEYSRTQQATIERSETLIKTHSSTVEDEISIDQKPKTTRTIQMTPININGSSVSSCLIINSTDSVLRGAETNYLTFSPPRRQNNAMKENMSPQTNNKVASKKFRKPFNENVSCNENKGACIQIPNQPKRKKDVHYSIPKLILSGKKRRIVEKPVTLMDTDKILAEHANPSYCITATTLNPFINSVVFYDQQWFDEREKEFVRWLNGLLTPPEQLSSSDELPKVDVADMWKKSCNSEVALAPSRETVSSRYLVNHRLDSLRRKACAMFRLPSVAQILSKVIVQIEKGILSIRKDRNIILDIGLKTAIVELLLCYNPLWLRIGLETIMGRTIPLESNSDRVGMITFIAQNILSDPYLVERYAYTGVIKIFKPGFEEAMKKHVLKKFFLLVFFLDYAKENKLIVHNPCLFCKNAQYKESRDLLLAFARDCLSGIGDVTKHLRNLGYIVKHKQTYLDEFNYAVRHLGSDLRDGVRLTKVTEIILQESSLTSCMRTPAISKLQKIHNVKVALSALRKAGHVVEGDITAKDIVEGHREKTMSLLWQIIYKFQISRFSSAASLIQNWYQSLPICISRRIWLRKEAMRRKVIEDKASTVIQRHWRGYAARKRYQECIYSVYRIQKWYKSARLMKQRRTEYLRMRNAIVRIQRFVRMVHKKKEKVRLDVQTAAVNKISMWYYNIKRTRSKESHFRTLECAAVCIQRWYRAVCVAKQLRQQFVLKRICVLYIQRWFRNLVVSKTQRLLYLKQKKAAIIIQRQCRLMILTRKLRSRYLLQKRATIIIQRWYQACTIMKKQRKDYLRIHAATCTIQEQYRATRRLQKDMQSFMRTKNAVLKIQSWFRSIILMRLHRACYVEMRTSIINIQIWYRVTMLMKKQRKLYLQQQSAALIIQRRFRAVKLGNQQKHRYHLQRHAVVVIQSWYRHLCVMQLQRQQYLKERNAALVIQRNFRSVMLTRKQRYIYISKRSAVLKIQLWYHACLAMRVQRMHYIEQQTAVRKIQTFFRGRKLIQQHMRAFKEKRDAALKIQIWYRACVVKRSQRVCCIQQTAARKLQTYFRNRKLMLQHKEAFKIQRIAAKRIQTWYRCTIIMKQERAYYVKLRTCTVIIQAWFRATNCMRKQRFLYLRQRDAAIVLQRKFRALCEHRKQQHHYNFQQMSAIKIQKWFRKLLLTQKLRQQYLEEIEAGEKYAIQIKCSAAMKIQMWYRSCVAARVQTEKNVNPCITHESASSSEESRIDQQQEAALQKCATKIQACWRGYQLRKVLNICTILPSVESSKKHVLDERFSLRSKYLKALSSFQFLPCHSYTVLLNASLLIETAVRLSPEICEEFLQSSHLETVVLLLETMNRSVPAEHLLSVLLKILTHVLRHIFGIPYVLKNERTIPTLVDLTNTWCMKRTEETFCYLCTVWWLLGQDQEIALALKNSKTVSAQLLKSYAKVKTWNTRNLRSTATPVRNRLPELAPYWHLGRTDRPRMFQNGKFGITEVLRKLDIDTP